MLYYCASSTALLALNLYIHWSPLKENHSPASAIHTFLRTMPWTNFSPITSFACLPSVIFYLTLCTMYGIHEFYFNCKQNIITFLLLRLLVSPHSKKIFKFTENVLKVSKSSFKSLKRVKSTKSFKACIGLILFITCHSCLIIHLAF